MKLMSNRWLRFLLSGTVRRSIWARMVSRETRRRFPGTLLSLRDPIPAGRISIGYGTYGSPTIRVFGEGNAVSIGRYCSVGEDVLILAGGNHDHQRASLYPHRSRLLGKDVDAQSKGPISIGHDVWIGARAIIVSGVTIGNGAVIGAGAVVASDIPAYAIAVGNPARVVKYRFPEAQRRALEQIAWWDWPRDAISRLTDEFCLSVEEFVEIHRGAAEQRTVTS